MFSGCRNAHINNVEPKTSNFSCNFSVEDTDFSGTLDVDDEFKCIFTFDSPPEMSGTIITVYDDVVLVEANGYSSRFDADDIPENSFTLMVQNALKTADISKIVNNRDITYIDGLTNSGNFRIEFFHTGYIQNITFFEPDSLIEFSNTIEYEE